MPALSNRERRALMTVALVVALSAVVQWMRPHETKIKQFDYSLQDSLFKVLSSDTAKPAGQEKTHLQLIRSPQKRKASTRKAKKKMLSPGSINPNTATVKELECLPYIGPKTAQAIVSYRREHGPFKSIEELDNVKRIGPKTIERIRPYLIFSGKKTKPDSGQIVKKP